jgi:hypothetical protein
VYCTYSAAAEVPYLVQEMALELALMLESESVFAALRLVAMAMLALMLTLMLGLEIGVAALKPMLKPMLKPTLKLMLKTMLR